MDEIQALRQEVVSLKKEVAELSKKMVEMDAWMLGAYDVSYALFPYLLLGHRAFAKTLALLKKGADRYDELLAHPERAEEKESLVQYEPMKLLYLRCDMLGMWPESGGDQLRQLMRRVQHKS